MVNTIDAILKALQLRLEVVTSSNTSQIRITQAVLLLHDVLDLLRSHRDPQANGHLIRLKVEGTDMQNIKLQLDPVVSLLALIVTSSEKKAKTSGFLDSQDSAALSAVLRTISSIAGFEGWDGLVRSHLTSGKVVLLADTLVEAKAIRALTEVILLAQQLGKVDEDWKRTLAVVTGKPEVNQSLIARLQSQSCKRGEEKGRILRALSKGQVTVLSEAENGGICRFGAAEEEDDFDHVSERRVERSEVVQIEQTLQKVSAISLDTEASYGKVSFSEAIHVFFFRVI